MAEELDNLESFEAKKTANHLPLGWLLLLAGLILWGTYYLYEYTPSLGGWSQLKEFEDSAKKEPAANPIQAAPEQAPNPFAKNTQAIADGKNIYAEKCAACHGAGAEGVIGPNLKKKDFLGQPGDAPDSVYFEAINKGIAAGAIIGGKTAKGGMPAFGSSLDKDKIWSLVAYIRSIQEK